MNATSKKNILIGLTVLVSIALLYWGIEYLKGVNLFKPTNYYLAEFNSVEGLNVSAPVTVNGYQVGLVRDIDYDYNRNKIVVEMSFDKELKVPHGSEVMLDQSLLGDASLVLTLGDGTTYFSQGEVIPSKMESGLMDAVSEDIMPQVTNMMPKLDSILGSVNTVLANPALPAATTRLDAITLELAASAKQLNALMAALNKQLPGMMKNADGTLANAAYLTNDLKTTTGNLNELTYSLNNLPLDSTLNKLNATLANLQKLTNELNSTDGTLGALMHDRQLYNNASNAVASLDSLLTDIKAHPKRYVTIKVF